MVPDEPRLISGIGRPRDRTRGRTNHDSPAGTSRVTTAPAPTNAPRPMTRPCRTTAPLPTVTSSSRRTEPETLAPGYTLTKSPNTVSCPTVAL